MIPLDRGGKSVGESRLPDLLLTVGTAMKSRSRTALLAGCVLSFVALPGLSRDAHAAPIDNDVSMEWQQTTFSDFTPTVVNGNFVINNASDLSTVGILIAITQSQYLGGFTLWVDVVNPITSTPGDYTPILAGGSPLRLTFAAGHDNNGNANDPSAFIPIVGVTNPAADTDLGGDPSIPKNLNRLLLLSTLQNSLQTFTPDPVDPNLGGTWSTVPAEETLAVLTSLLASGPLGFSINAIFTGNVLSPADLDCQLGGFDDGICPPFSSVGGSASITVIGGDPFPAVVPEPASISLVLLGAAGFVRARMRRRR